MCQFSGSDRGCVHQFSGGQRLNRMNAEAAMGLCKVRVVVGLCMISAMAGHAWLVQWRVMHGW